MPLVERKSGAFRDWTEDDEQAELSLPLPQGTVKKDIVCVLTGESLTVRQAKLGTTLLRIEPLCGVAVPEESTWYVDAESDLLMVVIAKGKIGATKSDQYWGASLAAKGGTFECWLSPAEVKSAREVREAKAKQDELDRHARVKASQRALRAAEAANEQSTKEALRPKRRRPPPSDVGRQEGRDGGGWMGVGYSWIFIGIGLAALAILFEVGALPLLRSLAKWATERLESRAGGGAAAAPEEGASESWMDEQEVESP